MAVELITGLNVLTDVRIYSVGLIDYWFKHVLTDVRIYSIRLHANDREQRCYREFTKLPSSVVPLASNGNDVGSYQAAQANLTDGAGGSNEKP